ncbi:MAG: hypothetical protein HY394_06010 [Candidatus Diapherotrites archaeon]|nr:hypothetical protein [Candidatus Diapherotrites archaeon]
MAKRALIRKKVAIENIKPVVKEAVEAGKAAEKALKQLEQTKGVARQPVAKAVPKRASRRKAAKKPAIRTARPVKASVKRAVKRAAAKPRPARAAGKIARPAKARAIKPAVVKPAVAKRPAQKKPVKRRKPLPVSSKIFAVRVGSVKKTIDANKKAALKREKRQAGSLKKLKKEILKVSKVSTTLNKLETQTKNNLKGFSDKFGEVERVVEANTRSLTEIKALVSRPPEETKGTVEEIKTLIRGKFVDFSSALEVHGIRIGKIESRLDRLEAPVEEKARPTPAVVAEARPAVLAEAKPSVNETEITEPKKPEAVAEAIPLPAPPTSKEIALHDTVNDLKARVSGLEEKVAGLPSNERVDGIEARIFEKLDRLKSELGEASATAGSAESVKEIRLKVSDLEEKVSALPADYSSPRQVDDLRRKMLEFEDRFLSQSDDDRAKLTEKRIFDELDIVKQQLKEVIDSKVVVQPETVTIAKKSVDEVAHDIVDLYFREIARLGFKRKLDLEDTVKAYEFVRNKLLAHQTVTPEMIESEIKAQKFKKENQ